MDYTRARDELKTHLREYVESITDKSQSGMYVCPLCHSGEGRHHTGAFSVNAKDPTSWHCFSCNSGGDIFDLIGEVEHIPEPLRQLERAAEIYGIKLDQNQPKTEQHTHTDIHTNTYTQKDTHTEKDNSPALIQYFAECNARLQETDYHIKRGISTETANRFMIGYDPQYKFGKTSAPALIIPTGTHNFTVRNISPIAKENNRFRRYSTTVPFNENVLTRATKPIFITEGELDALSIIEAGGEAIGLGGTSMVSTFVGDYVKKHKPAYPLILALDNDEAGQAATEQLAAELDKLKVTYYRYNPYGEYKDANEALLADREAFKQAITRAAYIEREAQEAEWIEYRNTSAANHIAEFEDGIKESANTPPQTTGFIELDKALDGGLYEGLYIIGAITSLGKTALALQIADQIAQSGRDVLIFSLEMARTELMSRSISRHTYKEAIERYGDTKNAKTSRGITDGARRKNYSQAEIEIIDRAVDAYKQYAQHIYIHEGIGDIGVAKVREEIEKHIRITGSKPVVLIDYVQILAPADPRATDKQNIDKAVLELKRITRDYKLSVIGISSFNRDNYTAPVNLASFKESGAIEYSSDVLIGLQYEGMDYQEGETEKNRDKRIRTLINNAVKDGKNGKSQSIQVKVLKNRNGSKGDAMLDFYPMFNCFEEQEELPFVQRTRL